MNLRLPAIIAALVFSAAAHAEPLRFHIYHAVQGDTLIKLASHFLVNKNDWQTLLKHNELKDPNRITIGTAIRIPVAAMRTELTPAVVTAIKGRVESGAQPVVSGANLREGDTIKTGDDGFVTLKLADGSSITVQAKSILRIERTRQIMNTGGSMDSVLRLESGRLETRAAAQKGPAARYEIRTPTSNMGVRGTVFRVAADEYGKKGQGEVTEGLVAVESSSGETARESVKPLGLAAGFGSIIEAGKPPSAPVALLPPPDLAGLPASMAKTDMSVTFPAIANAVAYRAEVALDAAFTNLVADASVPASANAPTLLLKGLPDGELYVRARGIDAVGLEGKDAVHPIRVSARPFAPALQLPLDRGRVNSGAIRFAWKPAPEAASYRLQVAEREDFAKPVADKVAPAAPAFALEPPLKSGSYVWRVASVNAKGVTGPWSDVQRFEVSATAPLLKPKHGQKNIILLLDKVADQQYQVQVARDERFTKIVLDRVANAPEVELTGLSVNAYFVRLRRVALDAGNTPAAGGAWSDTGTLEVYPGDWWLATYATPAR